MEKRFRNGLVLGKFLPPHKGHLYLIDSAREECEDVYVLACSIEEEPIPGQIRYEALRYLYSNDPHVHIIPVTDENPQYPNESTSVGEFYAIWVNTVYNYVDELDVVFTSEVYGKEFAKYLGIRYVDVDIPRKKYPVSGTKVRENTENNWEFLPDVVKNYFIKKVVLVGPESSGKTTLSKMLSEHYNTVNVHEYGREYVESNKLNKNTKDELSLMDISHIAAGQITLEDSLCSKANKLLICDTNLMITQIWSEIYFKECPKWIVDESHSRQYDLHLLMDIDFEWQDDGTREFPELRKWHFNRIKDELDSRCLNYRLISGTIEERFEKSKAIIDQLLDIKS